MFKNLKSLMSRACFGTGNGCQTAAPLASQDKPAPADRQRWTFEWPAEAWARTETATVDGFARWLHEHGESDVSRRQLCSLWHEFIEANELRPVSWREFDRGLKSAGIVRFRSSLPGRPWLYRVIAPRSAVVYRMQSRAA